MAAEGVYPRLNGALLKSGQYDGQIVSVVGRVVSFDGQTVRCDCADHQRVEMVCDPSVVVEAPQGTVMELVGLAGNTNSPMTIYVARPLSDTMDLDLYNRMLLEVLRNPKFTTYFTQTA
mmetsp:Transcript_23568/g.40001  ORF Transcript_23568/g.40001 Transcript_23568/m.40001 type:complete len:119 (-) Transcript_23568:174-530(-)|eukprot:CAMPEP_0116568324 /NCGR_PEP_ID=MMETSP0397-20121206/15578_1 /TAXON_ID=216820 /ORGANISM="Cyclophora tenuis, Strain ECT3854" /LENGTH=118 /DNA_ID=CAMNT_0004095571 /DNA_START=44 /DNA_END=400 /DNA_ORIENTATION=-